MIQTSQQNFLTPQEVAQIMANHHKGAAISITYKQSNGGMAKAIGGSVKYDHRKDVHYNEPYVPGTSTFRQLKPDELLELDATNLGPQLIHKIEVRRSNGLKYVILSTNGYKIILDDNGNEIDREYRKYQTIPIEKIYQIQSGGNIYSAQDIQSNIDA